MHSLQVFMWPCGDKRLFKEALCASTWVVLTSKIIEPRVVVSEPEWVFSAWPSSCGKGRPLLRPRREKQQSVKDPHIT